MQILGIILYLMIATAGYLDRRSRVPRAFVIIATKTGVFSMVINASDCYDIDVAGGN
ncbi:MAG: hypothetical protein LUQ22_01715 [Methanotrichaceae archaeon]|nr:hypothetical protein [Methanotrichaceae archaeon]